MHQMWSSSWIDRIRHMVAQRRILRFVAWWCETVLFLELRALCEVEDLIVKRVVRFHEGCFRWPSVSTICQIGRILEVTGFVTTRREGLRIPSHQYDYLS